MPQLRDEPLSLMTAALALLLALPGGLGAAAAPPESGSPPWVCVKAREGALPGEMLLVAVRGHDDGLIPAGRFGPEPLCFWRAASGTYLSFAGLDLDASTGTRTMELELWGADGGHSAWEQEVVVGPKAFPEQRLKVDDRYVRLRPEDEARAGREAARLNEVYSRRTPESFLSGSFGEPLSGRVSAAFGERRVFNGFPKSPHAGVDIAAPAGTPVLAPQGGLVALAEELFYSGNTVVLDHGCGLFTYYGHLSRISVKTGAMVRRGEALGLVGATGRVTGPHLHWTARLGRARVDPASLTALDLGFWAGPAAGDNGR